MEDVQKIKAEIKALKETISDMEDNNRLLRRVESYQFTPTEIGEIIANQRRNDRLNMAVREALNYNGV